MKQQQNWVIIGSELSPYTLKLASMCHYVGLDFRMLPATGSTIENIRYLIRKEGLVRGLLPLSWPKKSSLDEYPLVPFLFGPNGENLFDSSSIGEWLDTQAPLPPIRPKLIPSHNAAQKFLTHLIDEFADEFVLYLVHHNRWAQSAKDNNAGDRLATELKSLLGPLQPFYSRWFSRRQVKRMPYLFSVAKADFFIPDLSNERQPPSRLGFPATHDLLNDCYLELLGQLNTIFEQRATLISSEFTLADASIYGQFAMNLTDPSTRSTIQTKAPSLFAWLEQRRQHRVPKTTPTQSANDEGDMTHLKPLLKTICESYVPIMHQNLKAWKTYNARGETIFNEKAFWKNKSLFEGMIRGEKYRSVVKTFQVKSWLALRSQWNALPSTTKSELNAYLPLNHGLDKDY